MLKRLHFLTILEAGFTGLFFVQAVRFLIGMLYSRVAGASAVPALQAAQIPITGPAVDPALVNTEITFLLYMIALPLITLILGRFRVADRRRGGRRRRRSPADDAARHPDADRRGGAGAGRGAGLHRHDRALPGADAPVHVHPRLWRGSAVPRGRQHASIRRLSPRFLNIQIGLTVAAILISIVAYLAQRQRERDDESGISPDYGLLPFWGAVGLSGLLYLELALLALPNAIAGRADTDYTTIRAVRAGGDAAAADPGGARASARALSACSTAMCAAGCGCC